MKSRTKKMLAIGRALALVSQLAISFITPIFLGIYTLKRFNIDSEGFNLLAILVGTAVGISSAFGLLLRSYKS